jgi:sigma-B regulation protein RsbU (phosphoserine phosphatase)
MLCWILAVTAPIYAGALYMSYQATANRLEAGAERDADELAARLAAGVDAVIRPMEGGIRTVAYQLEEVDSPLAQYPQRIRGILAAWPDVYGSTIAVEVGNGVAGAKPFAPYFFRRGGGIGYSDLALASYGYRELPWYRRAADSLRPVWSLPYFDAGGGDIWMVTYSVPFFRKEADARRVLAGVVTADLDLQWVTEAAANVPLGPIGMGWLLSPPAKESFVAPVGDSAQRFEQFEATMDQAAIRGFGEGMLARQVTFERLPAAVVPRDAYLAVRHLETLDWRLMLVVPRMELLAEARALLNRQLALGAIGLLILVAAISLVAAGIARPVHALAESVSKAREEDVDFELPAVSRHDEVGVLTEALRRLRDSLQRHIQLRAESLAEQARLEHELEIAASIQQSMLPRRDSAAALPTAARVAAALLPAKQVGGDLYDYFELRDGNILFAVGDVSDKGIPAALFMARLSALLRVLGAAGEMPDRLLAGVNSRLVEGNDAAMFVTLGCGVLNVETGRIRYASAGHDAPLLRTLEGNVIPLTAENGPAIGIEATVDYRLTEGFMAPGDTLVLFTDGVTEAEASDGSLFGVERLVALLGDAPDGDPAALVRRIVDTVATHASGFRASDDLTVMAVSLNPPDVTTRCDADGAHWLIVPEVSTPGIRQAQQWLHAILAARAIDPGRIGDVELIAEELLTNIARAADTHDAEVQVSIACSLTPSEIVLIVRDDAVAFDPLARQSPNLDGDIADREIGGLGILLVKRLADSCRYSRVDGCNVLEIRLGRIPDSNGGRSHDAQDHS